MSFEYLKKLPSPEEIRKQYPITKTLAEKKAKRDQEIRHIITGQSQKFLVIIGPCSADNEDAVCDYICRLARVQEKVKDKLLLIPRIYTNKPRTTRRAIFRPCPSITDIATARISGARHSENRTPKRSPQRTATSVRSCMRRSVSTPTLRLRTRRAPS